VKLWRRLQLARARHACRLPLQRELLHRPLPAPGTSVADLELIALDFETTGLDPRRDYIVAAGWVRIRGDRIVMADARELKVQSAAPGGVGQSATIHGILDSDLEAAASVSVLIEQLLPELAGRPVVAHAAAIERGFLSTLLRSVGGVPLLNPFVDTMSLERKLAEAAGVSVRELHGDLTLDACRARHGLPEHQRHSAGADAIACAELFLAQLSQLGDVATLRLRDLY
jgi:DNA polymerase-3 subunit epsilon